MASSSILPLCTTKTPSSTKPSHFPLHGKRSTNQLFKVSCMAEHAANLDRRNLLLGLGGLYGAANYLAPLASSAEPSGAIQPPDYLNSCGTAQIEKGVDVPYSCCPPKPDDVDKIQYYKLPTVSKLRIRQPAHTLSEDYIKKYQTAIKKMKDLDITDPSDPRGFMQQANIHCAYCNNAYTADGQKFQVHESWLFFPFHRWYLYFYERILGSLIGDPTFALPYWNWDNPSGMYFPPKYNVKYLYDARRNQGNTITGHIMDLGYFGEDKGEVMTEISPQQIQANNLALMYRQMVTNAPSPMDFFGGRYTLGSNPDPGPGTIEYIPHTPVHIWTGTEAGTVFPNGAKSYGEDMGNFYSASLDPVFSCHHANVDRMWKIWKTLGGNRADLTDPDWLNSGFFFYDEQKKPWFVKVRDCLDINSMGYDYAYMDTPWNKKPQKSSTIGKVDTSSVKAAGDVFPLSKLDKTISFSIKRPATSRSQQEKDEKEEMLIFKGVKYDDREYIRFDVFLNADKTVNAYELDTIEYAGGYSSLPHANAHKASHEHVLREFKLAITELLEDNGLEDDDTIVVTVVPKKGGEMLSFQSVAIELR